MCRLFVDRLCTGGNCPAPFAALPGHPGKRDTPISVPLKPVSLRVIRLPAVFSRSPSMPVKRARLGPRPAAAARAPPARRFWLSGLLKQGLRLSFQRKAGVLMGRDAGMQSCPAQFKDRLGCVPFSSGHTRSAVGVAAKKSVYEPVFRRRHREARGCTKRRPVRLAGSISGTMALKPGINASSPHPPERRPRG